MSPAPPYLSLEPESQASSLLAQAHLTLFRIQLKFSISNFVLCSTLLGLVADCCTHKRTWRLDQWKPRSAGEEIFSETYSVDFENKKNGWASNYNRDFLKFPDGLFLP